MTEVRSRTRPVQPVAPPVRARTRPVAQSRVRNVDVDKLIASGNEAPHFERALPGVSVSCGICYGSTHERAFLGRIIRHSSTRFEVAIYKGKGHENDPASYTKDVTTTYDDAMAVLRKKHEHRAQKAAEAPKTRSRKKELPTWATGTDLTKIRKRSR